MADDPVKEVQEPEYVRQRVVIPPLAYSRVILQPDSQSSPSDAYGRRRQAKALTGASSG